MEKTKKDRYRTAAPVETRSPIIEPEPKKPERFIIENKRLDGRTLDEFRPIFMKTGVISQAAGSSYLEIEHTKVICGIYGPRQTPRTLYSEQGKLNCSFKFATFACADARRKHAPDKEERDYSKLMEQALEAAVRLEAFPKSEVDVFVIVLQDAGAALAAAITAASLALADAAVEMYDLVTACSAAKVQSSVVLDPTSQEEKYSTAYATVAVMPSLNETTQMLLSGQMDQASLMETVELCQDGCSKIYAIMRKSISESTMRKSEEKQKAQEQQEQQK